ANSCTDNNLCTTDVCVEATDTCAHNNNTLPCDDGLFCNGTDTCGSGTCGHAGTPCTTECNNSCDESVDSCAVTAGTACSTDSNPCTIDACNGTGACAHTAGNSGVLCRAV